MTPSRLTQRRAPALLAAGGLLVTAGLAGLGPTTATASSHREAPMIAGLPQYDNTDVYAEPGASGFGDAHRQLAAVPRARGWSELLPLRGRRAPRHPHRQRRGRQARHHLPVDLQGPLPHQEHIPVQHRPRHVAQRQGPELLPDLPSGADQGQPDQGPRQERTRGTVQRGRGVNARLRQAA